MMRKITVVDDQVQREPDRRIDNVVAAIEAFMHAKAVRDRHMLAGDNAYSHQTDVDETREHLRDKLAELLATEGGPK